MGPCELVVVVLVPVLEGEGRQGGRIGKLKVSKVPIEDLAVTRRQVDITENTHAMAALQLF